MSNFVSVDKLYYAICTNDDLTSASYNTPKVFSAAAKVGIEPDTPSAQFYADGILQENATFVPGGKVNLEVSTLPLAVRADIYGHTLDGKGGIIESANDTPPYLCLLYRRKKANGKYRYVKVFKCQLMESKADAETQSNSIKFQTDVIAGVFLARIFDKNWRYNVDEEETGYVDVSSTFFTSVGVSDVTAPTVASTVPAANATAVAVGTTFVWTFSEAINPATVTTSNFTLTKDSDGSNVAGSVAYNSGTFAVTFTPSVALTAASKYLAIADADVSDLSGNKITQTVKIFTTA